MIAIFDIDGVLADNTLTHHLDCTKPEQHAAFGELIKTATTLPACNILRALAAQGAAIYLFTARSANLRFATENWLIDNNIPFDRNNLFMRQPQNNWAAHELKSTMLDAVRRTLEGVNTDEWLAFEDCPQTAQMYENNGVKTFLPGSLRPGAFLPGLLLK